MDLNELNELLKKHEKETDKIIIVKTDENIEFELNFKYNIVEILENRFSGILKEVIDRISIKEFENMIYPATNGILYNSMPLNITKIEILKSNEGFRYDFNI